MKNTWKTIVLSQAFLVFSIVFISFIATPILALDQGIENPDNSTSVSDLSICTDINDLQYLIDLPKGDYILLDLKDPTINSLSKPIVINEEITIAFNKDLVVESEIDSLFEIRSEGKLTLENKTNTPATITGNVKSSFANICGGSLALTNDITITGFGKSAIHVDPHGTFNMTGGEIKGNRAYSGGGVLISESGTFNLSGGKISGNTAEYTGGGICVSESGTFNMTGGVVSENTAKYGGGIRVEKGTLSLENGNIADNYAINGGGISIKGDSKVSISNTTIQSNKTSNKAHEGGLGGGIHSIFNNNEIILSSSVVKENTALYGGGIFVDSAKITISDCNIINNTANNGGGIRINGTGCIELDSGIISGNTANGNGGGVCIDVVKGATFTMNGGEIIENTAQGKEWRGHGAGLHIYNSDKIEGEPSIYLNGGSIVNNISSKKISGHALDITNQSSSFIAINGCKVGFVSMFENSSVKYYNSNPNITKIGYESDNNSVILDLCNTNPNNSPEQYAIFKLTETGVECTNNLPSEDETSLSESGYVDISYNENIPSIERLDRITINVDNPNSIEFTYTSGGIQTTTSEKNVEISAPRDSEVYFSTDYSSDYKIIWNGKLINSNDCSHLAIKNISLTIDIKYVPDVETIKCNENGIITEITLKNHDSIAFVYYVNGEVVDSVPTIGTYSVAIKSSLEYISDIICTVSIPSETPDIPMLIATSPISEYVDRIYFITVESTPVSIEIVSAHDMFEFNSENKVITTLKPAFGLKMEYGFTSVAIPKEIDKINTVFKDTEIVSMYIPGNVAIGTNIFKDTTTLEHVYLNEGLTNIPVGFAQGATSLKEISIPNSVTSIAGSSFTGCLNLTSVKYSSGLNNIPSFIFKDCIKLKEFTNYDNVKSIDMFAFTNTSIDTFNFNNVTFIGKCAFESTKLKSIVLNDNCEIQEGSFRTTSLEDITMSIDTIIVGNPFTEKWILPKPTITITGTCNETPISVTGTYSDADKTLTFSDNSESYSKYVEKLEYIFKNCSYYNPAASVSE